MIFTYIQGGLGNQMFQYACGLAVAHAKGVPLKLDVAQHEVKDRPYQLSAFNISATAATPLDFLRARVPSMGHSIPARMTRKLLQYTEGSRDITAKKLVFEPRTTFISEIFDVRDNCVLIGNWQSEKYFTSVADTVRKEFTLKDGLGAEAQRFAQMIHEEKRGTPVSFHVRRGDKVALARFASVHGSPDTSYYRDAAKLMREKVGRVVFYIFSDDMPWVQEHLLSELEPAVIVSSPGAIKDAEDITLMSLCHHHILAHSSFSWWGAWLNSRSDKVIIGPKRWYKKDIDTSDLTPASWIRLENTMV